MVASGLIGRDRELSRLVDAMDAASVGQPVLVSVTGPLGVGKTRLLRGLEEHVRASSAIFLAGRYHSDRPGPYIAWREALNASVTYLMGFGIPFARRIAGPFGKVLRSVAPAFDELEKGAPPLARLSPEEDRLRLFEAVLGYLRALSKNAPVVILLDNFQWAFEADYELASFLLRGFVGGSGKDSRAVQATPCSVMLAVAYRDDETPPDHPLRRVALGRPEPIRFLELRLQPFSQDEVRELLVAMGGGVAAFGSKEELDRLVGNVMLETGGNPYHVEEMAKAIITSPVPVNPAASAAAAPVAPAPAAADGKAAVAAIVSEVNATIAAGENPLRAVSEDGITIRAADNQTRQVVPSSSETTKRNLGDLVLLRVKVLSPEAQGVLRAASIIAEGIEFELLARLSDVDEDSLLDVIDELIRQRFLVERDRGDLFDFYQTVVREAVYGAVEDPERIRLHGKMAELLKERAHANPESYAALLALHAERAGDRVLASQSYLAAGDAALRGNRVDEAERYFDRARELGALVPTHADHTTTAEIEIDLRRGSLLLARGEPAEAAKVFEGIMAEAKERGDKPRAGAIAHRLGVAYALSGNHVLAIANLEWALEVSREIGDRQLEADALDGLGSAQQVRGNFDKALEYMREALALRKSLKDRVGATRALYGAGRALAAKGDLRHALKIHRDALKFSTHLSETAGAARGHGELGELYRLMGSPKRAAEHLDQALALGRKAGARDVEIAVLTSQALLALASGDLGNARRLVNDAIQMGRSVGDLKLLSMALLAAADEAMLRNDLVAAKGKYEEARALAGKLGDRPARAASARGLSQVARRAKALDSARAYLVEARKTHEKIGARLGELEDIVDVAGVALAEAIAHTGSSGGPRSRGGVNQMEVARDAIQKVLPEIAALHAIPLRARALLMLGELHLGLRQAGEAIAAAQEAYTLAESALSRDDALRARLVGARAYLLQKDVRRAGPMYRQALDILKAVAGQIADKTERLAYLAEPDRRSLVDEIKALAAKPAP
ncbi:MAG: tetratricopeptide repeat protein [Acidobacteriota bacterium]